MWRLPSTVHAPTLVAAFLLTLTPGIVHAQTFVAGKSTFRIVDGDTVARGRDRMRIRGIDAPETRASKCSAVEYPKGRAAVAHLRSLLEPPNRVTVRRYQRQRDVWGRQVVDLWTNGRSVAKEMIKAGHAVAYDGKTRPNWCQ